MPEFDDRPTGARSAYDDAVEASMPERSTADTEWTETRFSDEWVKAWHIFKERGYADYEAGRQAAMHARSQERFHSGGSGEVPAPPGPTREDYEWADGVLAKAERSSSGDARWTSKEEGQRILDASREVPAGLTEHEMREAIWTAEAVLRLALDGATVEYVQSYVRDALDALARSSPHPEVPEWTGERFAASRPRSQRASE